MFELSTEISLASENRVVLSVSVIRAVGDGGSDGVHLYHRYTFHNNIRTGVLRSPRVVRNYHLSSALRPRLGFICLILHWVYSPNKSSEMVNERSSLTKIAGKTKGVFKNTKSYGSTYDQKQVIDTKQKYRKLK